MKPILVVLALAAVPLLAGCTINRLAGTGDIAFRLAWDGESDLDLYVEDASGSCISFFSRESPSGGILDVDCNATSDSLCAAPVENVYWRAGSVPDGEYVFWAQAHSLIPYGTQLRFQLQILLGAEVVWAHGATAREYGQVEGPFRLEVRRRRLHGRINQVQHPFPNCFRPTPRAAP